MLQAFREYVEVRASGFTEGFEEFIRDNNGGGDVIELTPGPGGVGGPGGNGWLRGAQAALDAINRMIAENALPPHEMAKIQNAKAALEQFKNQFGSSDSLARLAALQQALQALRIVSAIPALSVIYLAFVNGALLMMLGMGIVELAGRALAVAWNCGPTGVAKMFRLFGYARSGLTPAEQTDALNLLEDVIGCAQGGTGTSLTAAQMAGIDQQETGSTDGWEASYTDRSEFPEEQQGNCQQCGQNPCICY